MRILEAALDTALDVLEARVHALVIVVVERAGGMVVVAFAHHSRRPGYWRGRLLAP